MGLPAGAGLVTFAFSGQITSVRDDTGVLGGSIHINDAFSGFYTFRLETPDSSTAQPLLGTYFGLESFLGTLGQVPFSSDAPGDGSIFVSLFAEIFPGEEDAYVASAPVLLRDEHATVGLLLLDTSGTAFENDSLPALPPELNRFDVTMFEVVDVAEVPRFRVVGEVSSLVFIPEPETMALLGVGVVLVARRRRTSSSDADAAKAIAPLVGSLSDRQEH